MPAIRKFSAYQRILPRIIPIRAPKCYRIVNLIEKVSLFRNKPYGRLTNRLPD